jgi:hypothetical protein
MPAWRMKTMKNPPYRPSWVDRFLDWLVALPIPTWLSVALIYLLVVASYHFALFLDGTLPPGGIDPSAAFNALWSIIGIVFLILLDRIAHRAIDRFSVLVPAKKKELELIRYQMTNIPARSTMVFTVLIVLLILVSSFFDPNFLFVDHPVSVAIFIVFAAFSYAFAPIMLYHGFRQLNLVIKAYRMVDEINLFHLQPLYAFSGLTMTSSLFWLLILNMNFVSNFSDGAPTSLADIFLAYALILPYIILAFITFIVPLWGIHQRIQRTKEVEIEKNGMQIEKMHSTLYKHLNKGDYKKGNDLEKSLASLYKMREQIEKVPTWPWNPGTLRSFLSAVFLPLGIWLLQQVLSRFL